MKKKELNVVSVSGGKDSTALYLLCVEILGNDFLPVFADTGHEHPVTVNYVKNLHIMGHGPEVKIVKADFEKKLAQRGKKASGLPMMDLIVWKNRAPSARAQFCTEHLKLWPILFYLEREFPRSEYEWVMYTGIRKGESKKRSKILNPFSWNGFFDCFSVMPMLYEKKQKIFDLMKDFSVPPNPLYALGYGRVGCFPCIHSTKKELEILPDWAWERLASYEKAVGRTWFAPDTLPKHLRPNKELPTIEMVREWSKTSRGGSQYNMFKTGKTEDAPSCMTGFVVCE